MSSPSDGSGQTVNHQEIRVQPDEGGERIDVFLAKRTGKTRSQIQKLIESANIVVDGRTVKPNYRVRAGDVISMTFGRQEACSLIAEPIPLDILYRDAHLIVVNKPAGMVVYPAAGHNRGTLMNALAAVCDHFASVGGPLRPGVVHRLDKETSGVMVVALDDDAYHHLVGQFRERSIRRSYCALVLGRLKEDEGSIDMKIGRSESDRKKMSTRSRRGREAITHWTVIERFDHATLVRVRLGTGRTHQIRVHFASIGHPVLGDRTYGKKIVLATRRKRHILFPRQMLHAEVLGFIHPATGQYMEFSRPIPPDMGEKIGELRDAG